MLNRCMTFFVSLLLEVFLAEVIEATDIFLHFDCL